MNSNDARLLGQSVEQLLDQLPARISSSIFKWEEQRPEAIALRGSQGQACSYRELAQKVRSAQARLRERGVKQGDRVLLVNENSLTLAVLILALSELDAWAVVVNARLTAGELSRIKAHCEPRLCLYLLDSAAARAHWDALHAISPQGQRDVIDLGGLNSAEGSLSAAGALKAGLEPGIESTAGAADSTVGLTDDSSGCSAGSEPRDRVCVMIYTTGTTGDPKGVMLTHRNLLYVAAVSSALRGLQASDRVYCVLPLSHVFGLSAVFLATLHVGGELILAARFDAAETMQALHDYRATGMLGVPAMYAKLIEFNRESPTSVPELRFIYSGGAPLDPTIKRKTEALFGLPLLNAYGMTESGPTICQVRFNEPLTTCSVGQTLPGLAVRVLDQNGQEVSQGSVGELHVKGPGIMKGYFRNPEATAAVVDRDGYLNTGDLVSFDEAGNMSIAGRSKELIIHSGFNVYPPEVEAVIAKHPEVALCAVVGLEVDGNEAVCAYVQRSRGSSLDAAALKQFVSTELAAYKRPSRIVFVEQLPTAASGKVLKHRLKTHAA